MKKRYRGGNAMVALLAGILVGTTILSAAPALAAAASSTHLTAAMTGPNGSNGQQLSFSCPGMYLMEVQGNNQSGNLVVWPRAGYYKRVSNTGNTTNWWWVGATVIVWYDAGGRHTQYTNVPQSQSGSDWWKVSCP